MISLKLKFRTRALCHPKNKESSKVSRKENAMAGFFRIIDRETHSMIAQCV